MNIMLKNKKLLGLLAGVMIPLLFLSGCGSMLAENNKASDSFYDAMPGVSTDGFAAEYPEYDYEMEGVYDKVTSESSSTQASQINTGRKLIKTVNIHLETLEFDAFMAVVEDHIARVGGYVENSDVSGGGYYTASKRRYATITVRVPADQLDFFCAGVSDIANVTSRTENTRDVSLAYYDMESHMNALRAEYETLIGILEKCTELSDVISVQSRITDVLYQIEYYKTQLNNYDNLVAFSTVTLRVSEVEKETVIEKQTLSQRIAAAFSDALTDIEIDLQDFCVWFIGGLPYLVIWVLIIAVIVVIVRTMIRRGKRKKSMRNQPPQN